MLWHLTDWEELQVRWMECPHLSPEDLETELIARFRQEHPERRPFANRNK